MDGDELRLAAAIIRNAKDYAIFTMDGAGQITSWSPGAENVFGYSPAEAIRLNFRTLFTEADQAAGAPQREIATALAGGRAEDTRWHCRRSRELFWANGVTILMDGGGATALLKVVRDETPAREADEQRVLLLHELNHRIKNTLATVQSIVDQTLRGAEVSHRVRQTLAERLRAISDAHDVLVQESWAGADLHAIVHQTLAAFEHERTPRLFAEGPAVRLAPNQAVSIALALHELGTNAVKYGALGAAGGMVRLTWNLSQNGLGQRHLNLLWKEEGGPRVQPSGRRGFGTRLLERAFPQDEKARASLEMAPEGVRYSIALELIDEPGRPLDPRHEAARRTGPSAPPPLPPV
jgi:PAS domain S-box-containing protein